MAPSPHLPAHDEGMAAFRGAMSVLVVDDNAAMKYSIARQLRAEGYRTVEASSGAEALELGEFVSAVVLDMHLPDLDGLEVCRLLRSRPATAKLPVIHVSAARVDPLDALAAANAGADGFMVAPVDARLLASTLDRLLANSRGLAGSDNTMGRGSRSGAGMDSIFDQMVSDEKTLRRR
jgi:CheY-like chemotaxis protein